MSTKVAVVTGSNKGIGFAIVRGLCKRFDGVVYLTSRDEERGRQSVAALQKEGLNPQYHQLDITDKTSIEKLRDFIKEKHEGIDILVNNAAIAFKGNATEPASVQAKETLRVNYFSVLTTCEILFPILRQGGRVVNVSSSAGHLSLIPSVELRNKFLNPNLTIPELSDMMKQYVAAAEKDTHVPEWGKSSYVVSKVGVTALTKIQQRMLNERDIKVNAVHPGYVDTDMTSHKGPLSIEQGADPILYVALDAPDTLKGSYIWSNRKTVSWDGEKPAE